MEATAAERSARIAVPVSRAFSPEDTREPADDVLVLRVRSGDRAALDALVERYRSRIYAFALGMMLSAEDAEDVTQETFIRVCRTLDSYRARGQFRAWLYRIAANICRDHRRAERRRPTLPADETLHETLAASGDLQEQVTVREAVRDAIARLPEKYREVVALHYVEELSTTEIALILGRPGAAVRVQLWRARALLAKQLSWWLDDDPSGEG